MKSSIRLTTIGLVACFLIGTAPAQANVIQNSGFEQTQYSAGYYAYPGTTLDDWNYSGGAGIINASGSSAWYVGSGPSGFGGDQYAFVQQTGSLSQSFSGAGTFDLSFLDAGRSDFTQFGGNYSGNETFEVLIDGNVEGSFSTTSNSNFTSQSIDGIHLAAGPHILEFLGTDLNGGDQTAFIDDVDLTAIPEPGTMAVFGFALLVFGSFYGRRKIS